MLRSPVRRHRNSQAPYVTLLHTELGSLVRPIVSAAADGKIRWRTDFHRRRNIEVSLFEKIVNLEFDFPSQVRQWAKSLH